MNDDINRITSNALHAAGYTDLTNYDQSRIFSEGNTRLQGLISEKQTLIDSLQQPINSVNGNQITKTPEIPVIESSPVATPETPKLTKMISTKKQEIGTTPQDLVQEKQKIIDLKLKELLVLQGMK